MQCSMQSRSLSRPTLSPIKGDGRWFPNLTQSRAWQDYIAAVRWLGTIARHSRAPDRIDLALSFLSADAAIAHESHMSIYRLNLANPGTVPRWIKLIIDIYLVENPVHPEGHLGYFDKKILVRPLDSQKVQIGFDWKERAVFRIEGVDFPADGAWWGPCRRLGVYSVKALAAIGEGEIPAQLEIHQTLSR
jgi:hypothetical protein